MKRVVCKALIPGCDFVAEAEREEDLLERVATHAAHAHGIEEVTPELLTKVKSVIQTDEPRKR